MMVWNPATRSFDLLPTRMGVPRAEHTVTLMSDGRIMIVGGLSDPAGEPLRSTEIFDPGSNGLAPGPDLVSPRRWHAASGLFDSATVMVTDAATSPYHGVWKAFEEVRPRDDH